jgi:hypothetical protein
MIFKEISGEEQFASNNYTSLNWIGIDDAKSDHYLRTLYNIFAKTGVKSINFAPLQAIFRGYHGAYRPSDRQFDMDPIVFINLVLGRLNQTAKHELRHALEFQGSRRIFSTIFLQTSSTKGILKFMNESSGYSRKYSPHEFHTYLYDSRSNVIELTEKNESTPEKQAALIKNLKHVVSFQRSISLYAKELDQFFQDALKNEFFNLGMIDFYGGELGFASKHDALIKFDIKDYDKLNIVNDYLGKLRKYRSSILAQVDPSNSQYFLLSSDFVDYIGRLGEEFQEIQAGIKNSKMPLLFIMGDKPKKEKFFRAMHEFERTSEFQTKINTFQKEIFASTVEPIFKELGFNISELNRIVSLFQQDVNDLEDLIVDENKLTIIELKKIREIIVEMTKKFSSNTYTR